MQIFILSQFKIQSLEDIQKYTSDMIMDDLMGILNEISTKILTNMNHVNDVRKRDNRYKYVYKLNIEEVLK